jgi:hypothetical protein
MSQPDIKNSVRNSKSFWSMALILAVALVFCASAMTQTKPAAKQTTVKKTTTMGTTHTVTITPGAKWDDPPSVDQKSVTVDKSVGDEVAWICPACTGGFDVIFIDTGKKPFKDRSFNKSKNKSGKATGGNGTYTYKVIVNGGVLDPDVIIRGG